MDYTKIFLSSITDREQFDEAVKIVRDNSLGRVWLIGGFVYRGLVSQIYGTPRSDGVDYDFIVESAGAIKLPETWSLQYNRYGNPKFIGPSYEIDYVPLLNVHSIKRRNLEPTIDNFLTGTPLTIQSIAYDCLGQKIIGEIGLKAIREKVVEINDLDQAKHYAEKKNLSLEGLISRKAESLQF